MEAPRIVKLHPVPGVQSTGCPLQVFRPKQAGRLADIFSFVSYPLALAFCDQNKPYIVSQSEMETNGFCIMELRSADLGGVPSLASRGLCCPHRTFSSFHFFFLLCQGHLSICQGPTQYLDCRTFPRERQGVRKYLMIYHQTAASCSLSSLLDCLP